VSLALRTGRAAGAAAPIVCTIVSVSPNFGTDDGGDTVRITCTRLRSGDTVTIGGESATITASSYGVYTSGTYPYVDVTTPAGTAGLEDVVVTSVFGNDTLEDGFEYLDSGGGGVLPEDFIFHTDWATALGSGDDALRDTDKTVPWDSTQNAAAEDLEVIDATGLGFPAGMANVLEHTFNPNETTGHGRAAFLILPEGSIAAPGIGETLYHRIYIRCDYAGINQVAAGSHHPLENEQGSSGSVLWNWHPGAASDGTWANLLYWDDPGTVPTNWHHQNSNNYNNAANRLDQEAVYRYEWAITREDTASYSMKVRIYDTDDVTLLFPDTNGTETKMVNSNGSSTLLLEGAVLEGDVDILTGVRLGNNGWGVPVDGTQKDYWGGFAIRTEDWCGPYTDAEETP
jgi:hypothetical protein